MRWRDRLLAATGTPVPVEERQSTVDDLVMAFGGSQYLLSGGAPQGPPGVPSESAPDSFEQVVRQVYYRSGIVAACIAARAGLVSEARFKYRTFDTRKMYGDQSLVPLEKPTPNATSGDILARFEQDASLSGNAYRLRIGNELHHVRPDHMHIILGSNDPDYEMADAPDATVVAYAYWPGGPSGPYDPRFYDPRDVAHYAPEPDPLMRFRGVSWVSSVFHEIETDRQMTAHKGKFLEKGVPPFALKYPEEITRGDQGAERAKDIITMFREQHARASRDWEALHLFGGADPVSIGLNFRDLDFKTIQGAGETRIASRARVPAAVLGISEGLQGSALNAGNFGQARRQFGEQYAYPSLRQMCEALASLVAVPAGSELWYDLTDVAFLREDAKDAAEVIATQAQAIRTLVDGGMEADAAVGAVTGGDLSLLAGNHTGLVPVQLQPPGMSVDDDEEPREQPTINVDARTNVEMPVDARTTVDMPVTVESPDVTIDQAAPEVRVDVAPAEVRVDAPPPAEVTVNMPTPKPTTKTVHRDKAGNITAIVEDTDG